MELEQFTRLLAYEEWANRQMLDALRGLEDPPPEAVRLLSHLVASHRLWLGRLQGKTSAIAVWPELSLPQCQVQIRDLRNTWRVYIDALDEASLERMVQYVNTRGEPWSNSVRDILQHLIAHSAYHRGQLAVQLRDAGHSPPMTDFIHASRRGLIG